MFKNGHNKLTEKMVHEIVLLYMDGTPYVRIGEKYGIDRTTVMYHVKKAGVYEKRKGWVKKKGKRKYRLHEDILEVYNIEVEKDEARRLEERKHCLHEHWNKRCAACGATLGSEVGDSPNYCTNTHA